MDCELPVPKSWTTPEGSQEQPGDVPSSKRFSPAWTAQNDPDVYANHFSDNAEMEEGGRASQVSYEPKVWFDSSSFEWRTLSEAEIVEDYDPEAEDHDS